MKSQRVYKKYWTAHASDIYASYQQKKKNFCSSTFIHRSNLLQKISSITITKPSTTMHYEFLFHACYFEVTACCCCSSLLKVAFASIMCIYRTLRAFHYLTLRVKTEKLLWVIVLGLGRVLPSACVTFPPATVLEISETLCLGHACSFLARMLGSFHWLTIFWKERVRFQATSNIYEPVKSFEHSRQKRTSMAIGQGITLPRFLVL